MAVARKQKRTAEEYAEEIKALVRTRFPEAEFEFYKRPGREYDLYVLIDFDDLFDILDLTSPRTTDILIDTGMHIHVLPLGPTENSNS
jgi:hypothetical protein